jgi:hypothetical protein
MYSALSTSLQTTCHVVSLMQLKEFLEQHYQNYSITRNAEILRIADFIKFLKCEVGKLSVLHVTSARK